MRRLFFRLHRAKYGTPGRVPRLVLPQVERRVEIERLLEFVAALRYAAGGAVDERQVLVGSHAVRGAAQARVEARLEQLGRVGNLAVLVGSHSELQLVFALARRKQGASGHRQREKNGQ